MLSSAHSLISGTRKLKGFTGLDVTSLRNFTERIIAKRKVTKVQTPSLPSLRLHVGRSKPQKE